MSSHAAVHAAKRKLHLTPTDRGPEAPKKFRVESVHSKSTDSGIQEDNDNHPYGNSESCSGDEREERTVWVEDHYKAEIIGNLLVRETVRLPLGCRSSYIPYRHRIIDWMCRAKEALKICEEVHQLAVYFFDRYVDGASTLFLEAKLDLHVLCCIQLAAKTLEWDNRIPRNSDLNKLLERPFPLSEYAAVERRLLLFFQWNLTLPVVNTFLGLFRTYLLEDSHDLKDELLRYASYFEMTAVRHVSLQRLPPSLIASAIVYASRAIAGVEPPWASSVASVVRYKDLDLLPTVALLTKFLNNDHSSEAALIKSERIRRILGRL